MSTEPRKITNRQKRALANVLLHKTNEVVVFWPEVIEEWGEEYPDIKNLTVEDVEFLFSRWLSELPGENLTTKKGKHEQKDEGTK